MKAWTFAACVWLMACSSQNMPQLGDDYSPLEFPDQCPQTACATGPAIHQASDLIAQVAATLTWGSLGRDTTGCMSASDDLAITGAITVQGADVAVPSACSGCSTGSARFELVDAPSGVECVGPETFFDFTLCSAIFVHDTTVRLRPVIREVHPADGNYRAVVQVLPACDTACSATELTCTATHTCWASTRDLCAYCLNGDNLACACWDGRQSLPFGAYCEFYESEDTMWSGYCTDGGCLPHP